MVVISDKPFENRSGLVDEGNFFFQTAADGRRGGCINGRVGLAYQQYGHGVQSGINAQFFAKGIVIGAVQRHGQERGSKAEQEGQQQARAEILFQLFPDLEKAYNLYLDLVDIFNKDCKQGVARLKLARWYNDVEAFGYDGFSKVIETFENHNDTIINYFEDRLTNASAESFNAKIKAFRTQFRGVGDIRFFMYRLATLYS